MDPSEKRKVIIDFLTWLEETPLQIIPKEVEERGNDWEYIREHWDEVVDEYVQTSGSA